MVLPYGPEPLIILKNILSYICSSTIFEKHTAQGVYSKHVPGAVCISNMGPRAKFFQIINVPGLAYGPEPYGPGS